MLLLMLLMMLLQQQHCTAHNGWANVTVCAQVRFYFLRLFDLTRSSANIEFEMRPLGTETLFFR